MIGWLRLPRGTFNVYTIGVIGQYSMKNTYSTKGCSKFVFSFKTTVFTEMSESGDAGILSLPEEVLIKIAQHLGKKS